MMPTLDSLLWLPRWRRGWRSMQPCRAELVRHAWQVQAFSVAISVILWLLKPGAPFLGQLAYSMPIGLVTWALIDGGRFFIDQDSPHHFPRAWRGSALILCSVLIGFLLGTSLGDMFNGLPSFALFRNAPEFFIYVFLFSLATGIGISLFFYNQGKSAYLHAEIEAKSRQATEAQLKLLQSQLDPHMLFNTLANLRALIGQEPDRAVQMLDQLGDFLRATLNASRTQEHSLQAEFDRLRDYLSLMQIRLGDRLRYELVLPPELSQIKVPTLILQSLVENAVLHGLEPKIDGGTVRISASIKQEQLILQVSDDGMGFNTDTTHTTTQQGFGLAQVRERLQSWYGGQTTMDFIAFSAMNTSANPDIAPSYSFKTETQNITPGCQVTLTLPMRT